MPILGDWRPRKPEDMQKLKTARSASDQLALMATIKDFEIWDGERWVDGQQAMKSTFNVQAGED